MKKILLLLLLPFTLLSQDSWVNFEVRFDHYGTYESNFFMVGDSNGDTVMYYQPTMSYEVLDTMIYLNSGDYLVSLTDNYGDGWISNLPAWFKMSNSCQGDIINYDPLDQVFFTLDTLVNIWPCAPPVYGCVDVVAINYDLTATVDDGSCTYPSCDGFINSNAYQMCWGSQTAIQFEWEGDAANLNCDVVKLHIGDENGWSVNFGGYWPAANGLQGFAVAVGNGQMPPNWSVEHYMVLEYIDGVLSDTIFYTPSSCIEGCTDLTQESYNPWATIDDGSCSGTTCDTALQYQITMEVTLDNWPGETSWTMNSAGVIGEAVQGTYTFNDIGKTFTYNFCVDQNAGFELILNDSYGDGLAGSTSGGTLDGNIVIYDCNGDTIWMLPDPNFGGVTYSGPQAALPCATGPLVLGCTDNNYQEYSSLANTDDGSCTNLHVYGCTDNSMFNYDASATIMDLVTNCDYTLIIEDAASDGWGNSYLGISQGNMSWTYTMGPGSYSQSFSLALNSDEPVKIYYFEVGGPQTPPEEVQFQTWHNAFYLINLLGDTLLAEGTNPFANNGQGALQAFEAPFWKTYSSTPSCGNYCEIIVTGCMDLMAYNYNDLANTNDICYYTPGCTNPGYLEYYTQGFTADIDNGSCSTSIISGCTDPIAFNYDPLANLDNGGCLPVILGCMNELAFNYNPNANTPDTCTPVIYGCTSDIALNYDALANTDDGSCEGVIYGCMDINAFNYNPLANVNDNSCVDIVYGCMDATMFNYDPLANIDNGNCIPFVYGCTDSTMFNYDPLANADNNSCTSFIYGCTDPSMLNYNALANTEDFSCISFVYGCMDSTALNYDPLANTDNESCVTIVEGCMDQSAYNYDITANVHDSVSCFYDAGCVTGPGNPYWLNDPCYTWVISVDDYCCENEWDDICQLTYNYCDSTYTGPMPTRESLEDALIVYPNPASDKININKNVDINLYNYTGDMIISKQNANALDISKISSGMYMLQITYKNKIINKRIIKK